MNDDGVEWCECGCAVVEHKTTGHFVECLGHCLRCDCAMFKNTDKDGYFKSIALTVKG